MSDYKFSDLLNKTRKSAFNKGSYEVSIRFHRFIHSLMLHTDYKNKDNEVLPSPDDFLKRITPDFQRSNDIWSKAMQLKFIENILSGVRTELLFFNLKDDEDAQVIDGLQRTTAIIEFFKGNIKPFGHSVDELGDELSLFRTHLQIKIYTFDTWEEVGQFYIDMNENITHSSDDIQKAKDWFLNTYQISL